MRTSVFIFLLHFAVAFVVFFLMLFPIQSAGQDFVNKHLGKSYPLIKEALRVYPNPANNQIVTSLTISNRTNVNYTIYDLNGKIVKTIAGGQQQAGSYQKIMDVSGLQPGTYILSCITSNGVCHSKFVKQ